MVECITCDVDGVIFCGSNEAFVKTFLSVFKEFNLNVDEGRIRSLFGKGYRVILKEIFGYENPEAIKLFRKKLFSDEFCRDITPVPGLVNALETLKSMNVKLCVATGNDRKFLKYMFRRFHIPNVFDVIVTVDMVKKGKPHTDMLNLISSELNIKPDRIMYVGDSPIDVEMGKRFGCLTVVVLTGVLDLNAAKKLEPDYIIKDLTYIVNII